MKLMIILFLFSFKAAAFEWKVIQKKGNFLLINDKGRQFSVESVGGTPSFIGEKKLREDLLLVIYNSGTAGTSQPIQMQRALVFSKKKLVGDYPYLYVPSKGTTYKPEQPKWDLSKEKLVVIDGEEDKTYEISL